ncbi:MAG: hypothetical protein APF84_14150 [Gracilibacter sp. BRH_c7a]|nr:MAG: hypothetical protein APF84_14150 [Gracilibacter sp. BRH_c7a]
MIIGIGFGSPLVALLMLFTTAFISYTIFRTIKKSIQSSSFSDNSEDFKEKRRSFYYQQRDKAYEMMNEYDLSDKEIEDRIDEETHNRYF